MTTNISKVNTAATQDSFQTWADKTNEIIDVLSNNAVTADPSANGSQTTGNVFVVGIFGATTLKTSALGGGNVQSQGNLSITTNVVISNSANLVLGQFVASRNTVAVGANLIFTSNGIFLGNSSVNVTSNNSTLSFSNNLIITANGWSITGNSTVNASANVSTLKINNGNFENVVSNNATITNVNANVVVANTANVGSETVDQLSVNAVTGNTASFTNISANVVSANNFSGNGLFFSNLTITTITTNTVSGNVGTFTSLNWSGLANGANLSVSFGTIQTLSAQTGNVVTLTSNASTINYLTANNMSGNGAGIANVLKTYNNLSDITNSVNARNNLGLGSAATQNTTYFQTALGFTPVNKAGDTMTGALTVNGQITSNTDPYWTSGQMYIYGYGGNNARGIIRFGSSGSYYLYYDGSTYTFNGAHVNSAAGRLWGTGDFDYPITAMRMAYAGDITIGAGSETRDYWGGTVCTGFYYSYINCVTGVSYGSSSFVKTYTQGSGYSAPTITYGTAATSAYASATANVPYPRIERRRYLQAYRNNVGWYTVGYS